MARCVEIDSTFRKDFAPIVKAYASIINRVLKEYDVVVLVARKAACFFDALQKNGEIAFDDKHPCTVISSRALDFCHDALEGKRIAVVDDVIVSGASALRTVKALQDKGLECDVYVAAFSEGSLCGKYPFLVESAVQELDERLVCELAKELNFYIQVSAITNNVDQPIFHVSFVNEQGVRNVTDGSEWLDLSSADQQERGIINATMCLDTTKLFEDSLGSSFGISDALSKIRILSVSPSQANIVPFFILPEISSHEVEFLFDSVSFAGLEDVVQNPDPAVAAGNKLRVVSYALAKYIAENLIGDLYGVDTFLLSESSEKALFGKAITPFLKSSPLNPGVVKRSALPGGSISNTLIKQARSISYQGILTPSSKSMRKSISGERYATVESISNALSEGLLLDQKSQQLRVLVSACIDWLIDKGTLVPFTQTNSTGGCLSLVRAFRGGEIVRLAERGLLEFCLCLARFNEFADSPISQRAADILGTIFFRRSADEMDRADGASPVSYEFLFDPFAGIIMTKGRHTASITKLLAQKGLISISADGYAIVNDAVDLDQFLTPNDINEASAFAEAFAYAYALKPGRFCDLLEYLVVGNDWIGPIRCLMNDIESIHTVMDATSIRENAQFLMETLEDARRWLDLAKHPKGVDQELCEILGSSNRRSYALKMFSRTKEIVADARFKRSLEKLIYQFLCETENLVVSRHHPSRASLALLRGQGEAISKAGDIIEESIRKSDSSIMCSISEVAALGFRKPKANKRYEIFLQPPEKERTACVNGFLSTQSKNVKVFVAVDPSCTLFAVRGSFSSSRVRLKDLIPRSLCAAIEKTTSDLIERESKSLVLLSIEEHAREAAAFKETAMSMVDGTGFLIGGALPKKSITSSVEGYDIRAFRLRERHSGIIVGPGSFVCNIEGSTANTDRMSAFERRSRDSRNLDIVDMILQLIPEDSKDFQDVRKHANQLKLLAEISDESLDEVKEESLKRFLNAVARTGAMVSPESRSLEYYTRELRRYLEIYFSRPLQ